MDLSNWIEFWARFAPDRTAISWEGRKIGYGALRGLVRRLAVVLADGLEVRPGARVAYLGYNSPDLVALLFACARTGSVLVPLNWRLAVPELAYALADAGCETLVFEPRFAESAAAAVSDLPDCRPVDTTRLEGLVSRARAQPPGRGPGLESPLVLAYTSGTTSRPKGAVLTQAAVAFNAANAIAAYDMTCGDRVLTNLPMFHVGGLNIHTTPAFCAGAEVVLQPRFDPDAALAALAGERPNLMILVPALMRAVVDHRTWPDVDFSGLRCISTGSTVVPRPLLDAYLDRGVPVVQVYGTTETAPIAIHQRIEDAWSSAGSTGKPALYCDARIVDADGADVPSGGRGEILVRGPNVMTGYWRNGAATAEALRDGWFHTGDVGLVDDRGDYHVVDRIKDVIISGSENVYPAELERVLERAPEIAESAVVGRSDDRWGEVPVACVVLRRGCAMSREEILALFDGEIARYKHPRDIVFRESLPRNAMGKVLKHELRAALAL